MMVTEALAKLLAAHRSLMQRARTAECGCPDAIRNLGVALEIHGALLDCIPARARALLDEHVAEAIEADGVRIAENLAHFASVIELNPTSSEIDTLAAALLLRIREHLEWRDRALFHPLSRFYLERRGLPPADVNGARGSTGDQHDPDA